MKHAIARARELLDDMCPVLKVPEKAPLLDYDRALQDHAWRDPRTDRTRLPLRVRREAEARAVTWQ